MVWAVGEEVLTVGTWVDRIVDGGLGRIYTYLHRVVVASYVNAYPLFFVITGASTDANVSILENGYEVIPDTDFTSYCSWCNMQTRQDSKECSRAQYKGTLTAWCPNKAQTLCVSCQLAFPPVDAPQGIAPARCLQGWLHVVAFVFFSQVLGIIYIPRTNKDRKE